MTKDWEKVIAALAETYDFEGMAEAYEKQKIAWNAKNWEKFVREIRTKLLARVREEVMGQVYCTTSDNCGTCNVVRQQLKKLEIISEEGKE